MEVETMQGMPPAQGLYDPAQKDVFHLLKLGLIVALLWTFVRAINEIGIGGTG